MPESRSKRSTSFGRSNSRVLVHAVAPQNDRLFMRFSKADYQALAAFRRELRRFLAFSETVAQDYGVPAQQYQALLAITAEPKPMTVGALARELLIAQHSASELAQRLVSRGLLVRGNDPADRRRIRLSLTPEAETLLSQMARTHMEELSRMQPALVALFARLHAPRDEVSAEAGPRRRVGRDVVG